MSILPLGHSIIIFADVNNYENHIVNKVLFLQFASYLVVILTHQKQILIQVTLVV